MNKMLMVNVKEKFAQARELCPGMSEEVYALTDCFADVANDRLYPAGILMVLACIMDDLRTKRCSFAGQIEYSEYLVTHSAQVQAQMPFVLQVIDAIAEPDFAEAVRAECGEVFHWNVPKRVAISGKISEYENINAAVNWWAEAIQHPKMGNGDDDLAMLLAMFGGCVSRRQLTETDLWTFREKLTDGISKQMDIAKQIEVMGCVTLSVGYGPDRILGEAGAAIGLGQFDFPCNTTMWITESKVEVSVGYTVPVPRQTIWSANAS